jgi:predicted Na+-dependent transporter
VDHVILGHRDVWHGATMTPKDSQLILRQPKSVFIGVALTLGIMGSILQVIIVPVILGIFSQRFPLCFTIISYTSSDP